ncbi:hypothetical protein [Streptomyces sp. NPDC050738]|uniref:hypothetical protein n=1 Tax=Streptomyces sp. NPDC050738 TaxID=3154744 RepID=UPI00341C1DA8
MTYVPERQPEVPEQAGAGAKRPVLGPDATAESLPRDPAVGRTEGRDGREGPGAPPPVPDGASAAGRAEVRAESRADGAEPLIPVSEREKLSHRLQQAVNGFVDGPHHAVEEADRVFEETVKRVTDTLTERCGTLRTAWNGQEHESATEELRVALRTYREVTERLLEL